MNNNQDTVSKEAILGKLKKRGRHEGDSIVIPGGLLRKYRTTNGKVIWYLRFETVASKETWRSLRTAHLMRARREVAKMIEAEEAKRAGLEDPFAWAKQSALDALQSWLDAEISMSPDRRNYVEKYIRQALSRAGVKTLAELKPKILRTAVREHRKTACRDTVNKATIRPLRQWSAWLAEEEITPHHTLSGLRPLKKPDDEKPVRSYVPLEAVVCVALLDAAYDLDILYKRQSPGLAMALEVVLISGNRPGVVLSRRVSDLQRDRHGWYLNLPPGKGNKKNGDSRLTNDLAKRLASAVKDRPETSFQLTSGRGSRWDKKRYRSAWNNALSLAWVRLNALDAVRSLACQNIVQPEYSLA